MQKARKSCSEWGSKRSKKDNYVLEQQTKKKIPKTPVSQTNNRNKSKFTLTFSQCWLTIKLNQFIRKNVWAVDCEMAAGPICSYPGSWTSVYLIDPSLAFSLLLLCAFKQTARHPSMLFWAFFL